MEKKRGGDRKRYIQRQRETERDRWGDGAENTMNN